MWAGNDAAKIKNAHTGENAGIAFIGGSQRDTSHS